MALLASRIKLLSASTAIIVLASFFTLSVSQVTARADHSMLKSGEHFQYACPEKGICSALQESDDAAGLTHSGEEPYLGLINAYDGGGNSFSKAIQFDINTDLNGLLPGFLPEGHAIGLTCMSVGNCEGIVKVDVGGKNGPLHDDYDLAKNISETYFLVSEVSSVWQKPVMIKELSMVMKQTPQTYYWTGDIWCQSHGNCNMIGNTNNAKESQHKFPWSQYLGIQPFIATERNGVWGKPQFLLGNQLNNRGGYFYKLNCTTLADCTIYGSYVPSTTIEKNLLAQYGTYAGKTIRDPNSGAPLGLTFTMSAGKWGSPVTNLGPAFLGGPYPKADPNIVEGFPHNSYSPKVSTNAMACIQENDVSDCIFAVPTPPDSVSHPVLPPVKTAFPGSGAKCVVGNCPVGSVGPAGGIVFYDAGSVKPWGRYLEVAPAGWNDGAPDAGASWCDESKNTTLDLAAIKKGSANSQGSHPQNTIGLGRSQTAAMLKLCTSGAAYVASNYLGGNTSDWFLPSVGEMNALCQFAYGEKNSPTTECASIGNPGGGFVQSHYWTSNQLSAGAPFALVVYMGAQTRQRYSQNSASLSYGLPVRPIRAFASPAQPLVRASGLVQPAGVGDPSWPAKCPVVLDKAGGTQPKVTGFYNDGTKETFVRLGDNSTSAVTTPENIIGCYADLQSLTSKIGNGYHIGTISRDASGYYWLNAQGVRFGLVLNGTVMDTDKSNPYYDDGHQFVLKTAATSTANPQIQAPGAGASNWAAKCPAVIDTVGGAQPKISGFKFDASGGENYMRLTDGGSTAVTSPGNLLGCYADIPSLNTPQGNAWHVGTINRDANGFYWQNAAGVRWGLTLSGTILITDKSNPYYDKGHQFITY